MKKRYEVESNLGGSKDESASNPSKCGKTVLAVTEFKHQIERDENLM